MELPHANEFYDIVILMHLNRAKIQPDRVDLFLLTWRKFNGEISIYSSEVKHCLKEPGNPWFAREYVRRSFNSLPAWSVVTRNGVT
jgi:hypothetical protein